MNPRTLASIIALVLTAGFVSAQNPSAMNLTAKSANVGESGVPIKINIFRWSTEEERTPIVAALDPEAQAALAAAARGRGGGGGGGGGRGARAGGLDANDPALADVVGAGGANGAGGGGGRGGRGGGRGGRGDAAPAKVDPIVTLTTAIGKAPTLGFLWTNEVVGYSIKYAYRIPASDGGERIILATDRKLGAGSASWKTATGTTTNYEFTFIELRLDPKGVGEGKTSLTTKVVLDKEAKTIGLENYAGTPAVLQGVKR